VPLPLVFRYLLQTLHALRAAHRREVFHRGLKPEQLLLDGSGAVKVADFGFARIVERDQAVIRQVYVGMGNVAYLAPELYTDPSGAGAQADIYATGIICYELLTRKLPGRRSPMPSKVNAGVPAGFDDIFDRMTRDGLDERYPDVDAILADLDRLPALPELLGNPSMALPTDDLLAKVTFRPRADEPAGEGDGHGEGGEPTDGGEDGKGPSYRPYSLQQRHGKK
jgi:serine/threonine protein kinase